MRYMIMDTMLDASTVFLLGLVVTWMLHSCWDVFKAWWREGKRDIQVEIVDHDDPRIARAKTWGE